MEEWKEYKLGDIYEVHNGLSKGGKFFGSGYPFLSFSTVFNKWFLPAELSNLVQSTEKEQESFSIKKGDVFITRTSETAEELGMSCVALKDYPNATYNGFCKRMRQYNSNIEVDPKYIGYYLRNPNFRLRFQAFSGSMSTRASLTNEALLGLPINLPPLPTQQKIAQILSSLDDKIELNNKINANLEQQAQAMFKSWFVDFEPFGGEMPAGWRNTTLDSFCNIFTGRKNANASVENGQYKFFTCSPNPLPIDSFIFDGDAIIVSGNGAYTGRTRFYSGKFDLYQRTYACTMKEDINPEYVYLLYWIVKFVLSKKIMGGTHGSAIPYIVMDDIAKFEIRYDEKTFEELSKIMKSIVLQIQDNENQNEKLATLRDTLLPKLMSGELEVN